MKKKQAMMGNSSFTQQMMRGSGMPGYSEGGPVKKDGFLTDKKGKPYARVHEGEHVVPSATKKKLKKIVKELKGASKMHKSQADRIDSMASKEASVSHAWSKLAG